MLVAWKVDKGISGNLRHVLVVFWLEGVPRGPPQGPQRSQMDKLVFHEKSRYKIVLWDDLPMGKLGVSPMEGKQRNSL